MPSTTLPPPGHFLNSTWSPVRQAACEAIHRAVTQRKEDPTGTDLYAYAPELKQRIRRFVSNIDGRALSRLVARDMLAHGYFDDGWSQRWPASGARARSEPPDISREVDSARVPLPD